MKQQKEHWVKTLFSFAGPCKGKMTLSVLCAILSVAGGFVPFWAVYEILLLFIKRTATLNNIMLWCLVGVGGYLIRVICFGISTILAHISAYTILEGIRLKIANRLMRAPLGEVMGRRIGYLKNIIMDKVEDLEPPLAHMIPELTSNLLLPVAIFIWMLAIDWRLGLAVLIAPVLAMIPMFFLMRNYNSQYAAYMEANNHVNNVIIEYGRLGLHLQDGGLRVGEAVPQIGQHLHRDGILDPRQRGDLPAGDPRAPETGSQGRQAGHPLPC